MPSLVEIEFVRSELFGMFPTYFYCFVITGISHWTNLIQEYFVPSLV